MKVIREIGFRKTLRFLGYSVIQILYHHLIDHFLFFPQTRKIFLQITGAKIGKDTILMNIKFFNWHHMGPKGLKIGSNCFLADEVLIDLYNNVNIGNNVTLAQRVLILTHINVGYSNHPLQKYFPKNSKPVILKNDCVIGAGSTILPGIIIGERSFIGAGSIVTKDIPNDSLYAGIPAKLIRKIK